MGLDGAKSGLVDMYVGWLVLGVRVGSSVTLYVYYGEFRRVIVWGVSLVLCWSVHR